MSEQQEHATDYRKIAGRFTDLVRGVPNAATWDSPSPVQGWTARDVVRHLTEWFPGFLKGGANVDLPKGPDPDVDPLGAWTVMSDGVQAVLDDPTSQGRRLINPHTGDMPLPNAVAMFFTGDVFLHSWDLARATGQDETLDPDRCATMLEGMQPLDEILRSSGQYGPKIELPSDADVQSRLLAFIGRDPRRTA